MESLKISVLVILIFLTPYLHKTNDIFAYLHDPVARSMRPTSLTPQKFECPPICYYRVSVIKP
jgi:hypothetical protein